jgi:hypothetical protein
MKLSPIFAEACLHHRLARVGLNLAALILFPRHFRFYAAGIRRGFQKAPESRLGVLLAASHDCRKLRKPQ